jgi:hypothetical protein
MLVQYCDFGCAGNGLLLVSMELPSDPRRVVYSIDEFMPLPVENCIGFAEQHEVAKHI